MIFKLFFLVILLNNKIYGQIVKLNNELEEVNYNLKVENGEAIVSVPIPFPKGVNNLKPNIDLVYRSNTPQTINREIGISWMLSGLHEISRCPKNVFFDGKPTYTKYNFSDVFCYNGQRLILVNGQYGYDKSEYRTEIDTQQKIIVNGVQGEGPKMFKIFTKDNLILTFGENSDSVLNAMLTNNISLITINRWYLTSIVDYNQNEIRFNYLKEKNYCYLSNVSYANRVVNFIYEVRTDVQTKYYNNYLDIQISKRLKTVQITVNGQELKRLELAYINYGPTGLSLLESIKLCAYDACSRPLILDYDILSAKFMPNSGHANEICGTTSDVCELKQIADMNGDGLNDIIAFGSDGVYVSINNLNSFLPATKWTDDFSTFTNWTPDKHVRYIADMNNDGLPDILGFGENAVYVSYNANGRFNKIEKYHLIDGLRYSYSSGWRTNTNLRFLCDVEGDGIPDIIGLADAGLVINNNGLIEMFAALGLWGTTYPFYCEDLNANGLKGVAGFHDDYWVSYNIINAEKRPIYNNLFLYGNGWRVGTHTRFFADVNNDNLPDVVGFSSDQAYIGISSANSQLKNDINTILTIYGFSSVNTKTQIAKDVNGDGYVDLISFECNGVYVALNNGKSFLTAELWLKSIKSCDSDKRDLIDMNGDGMPDLVGFFANTVEIAYNQNREPKLIKLTDSFGNINTIKYSNLGIENVNKSMNASKIGNYSDFGHNPDVVTSLSSSDGIGGTNTIEYNYGPYRCGRIQGRNDCTFLWIKSTSKEKEISTMDEFYYEYPLTGVLKRRIQSYKNDNKPLQDTRYVYTVLKINMFINQIVLQQKSTVIFELNGEYIKTEITEMLYDKYLNPYKITKNVTDDKTTTYSRITQFKYFNNESLWWIGRIESKNELTLKQFDKIHEFSPSKDEFYEYNESTRTIKKKTRNPNDDLGIEETFFHDKFGNIVSIIQKPLKDNTPARSSLVKFDSFGINMIQRTNILSHHESFKYDVFDNVIESTDVNNLAVTHFYNSFGRRIKSIDEQDVITRVIYEWDAPRSLENSLYKITSITDDKIKEVTYYDSLNRVIRKERIGINGESIFEDSIYNSVGQLVKQSIPYKPTKEIAKYTLYEYDVLSRETVKKDLMKKGEIIYTEYLGLRLVKSDHLGRITANTKNILDQIVSIEDALGSVASYEYDFDGNLVKLVDPQGSIITMKYNLNGQKVFKNDSLTGIMHYSYNAFNELMTSTQSTGNVIRFERDNLGRMITRTEFEGTTKWIYDTAENGIGKLHKILDHGAYEREFKYDRGSNLIEQAYKYNEETASYTVSTKYDKYGRILVESYPSNVKIYKCYNDFGYLIAASMNDSSCKTSVLWKLSDSDARGNIVREQYGNDLATDYSYSDVNQISKITTNKIFSHKMFRQLEYTFDRRQNLISKTDTDIFGKNYQQKYDYDILNRLTLASNYEIINNKQTSLETSAWMYDSIGNLMFNHDPVEKTYLYDSMKPQQAVKIGTESLEYDDNGNVIETDAYKINWYSFSKVKSIITPNQTVSFSYGPERELISKTIITTKENTTVHYVGNNYEKWTIQKSANDIQYIEKFYVRVLDKVVATRIITTSSNSSSNISINSSSKSILLYQHYDAFDSVDMLTDETGSLLLKYSYTPFGKIKVSYSNISSNSLLATVLNSGYSKHDHIEGNRLINMNGRIFDTVYLRFLSPDPFIQDIYSIQSMNRYSYALNNPFKFKDPNGYFFKKVWKAITQPKVLLAIAVGIATAGLATAVVAPALISALGVTSTIAAGTISGAVVGSMSGFASTMIMTDGNVKESLKGAALGGLSGGIAGGLSTDFLPSGAASGFKDSLIEFANQKVGDGINNLVQKKSFFEGIEVSALSFAAAQLYKTVVGYEVTVESGGDAVPKGPNDPPVKGANNIGCQGGLTVCGSIPMEGGKLSVALNKVGGINAISGLHDMFQINLPNKYYMRDILNVPGMPVAAFVTYTGLINNIQCPLCF